ncbi:MAG: prepilin-type N-terminal cleavage/methylation domain-containing protein [Elusimicrobiaceae bacterium]|nr:prepilin-type N-terminal cleavage/methylation domain-containing protein [Elusimicrobiaceae bacterium]
MKKGFTLIELLVVVLIIGILSSMALPQYQVAVMKSRFATVQSNVKTIRDLFEVYYMANGEYPTKFSDAAVEIAGCSESEAGNVLSCGNTYYENANPVVYGVVKDKGTHSLTYTLGLAHTGYAGKIFCQSYEGHDVSDKVCKSMGGKYFDTTKYNWRRYEL